MLTILVSTSWSTRDAGAYPVAGRGKNTCAEYLASESTMLPGRFRYTEKDNAKYFTENMSYNEWILGYLSGINANTNHHERDRPDINYSSLDELYASVHEYCGTHPTERLEAAIAYLVRKRWAELGWEPSQSRKGSITQPTQSNAGIVPLVGQSPPAASAGAAALVVFQPTVTEADVDVLLRAYNATIVEGPDAAGAYKLQFAAPLTADQLRQYIDSLKSQSKIVKDAAAG